MNKTIRRIIPLLLILVLCAGFTPQKAEAATRLNTSSVSVGVQKTVTLKVIGANSKVKWSSSNKKVAMVNSKGVVKGIKKGTATITAKVKKKKYKCRVTVTQSAVGAKSGKKQAGTRISANTASVGIQKTMTLRMIGAKSKVKWKSSNKKIATVNSKGIVKGLKKGTVTITAKVKKKKYTCRVTVVQPVTSVRLNRTSAAMKNGSALSLGATAGPASANNRGIAWRSSNARVATVNANGTVRAVGKGTAVITATARDGSGKSASCRITVTQPVTSVRLNRTNATLKNGSTLSLGATAVPSNANNRAVTWRSSNARIATVSANGSVRAVGKGTAVITATARDGSGRSASCRVTVTQPVTGVRLNRTSASMNKGDSMALGATASPSNADNKAVTWKSSNTNVATVSASGAVRAAGKGTATITAVARDGSGKAASCTVTVVEPEPADPAEHVESVAVVREGSETTTEPAKSVDETEVSELGASTGPRESEDADPSVEPDMPSTPAIPVGPTIITTESPAKNEENHGTPEATHTHTWIDIVETVHHDEKSHTEKKQVGTKTVVDQEAYDEDVYEYMEVCSVCGKTSKSGSEMDDHIFIAHDGEASYFDKQVKTTIHHDAVTHEEPVYENVKVVDEEAWDEIVVTGQKCSECGATK